MDNKPAPASPPGDFADEELVVSNEEEKNYKGICISFCVIGCICSLIIISIVLLTPDDSLKRVKYPRLRIEEIAAKVFQPKEFDGFWVSENEVVYSDDRNIILFNVINRSSNIFVPNNIIRQFNVQKFTVSADKQFVLLIHEIIKTTHHSFKAKYKIYNISNEHIINLETIDGNQEFDFAEFGPKGNQMVYIYQNNIYYKSSVGDNASPIVETGRPGIVYNGIPDWLYGERIWKNNKAFWWNKSGNRLCFASFDDSLVDTISFIKYGSYENSYNLIPQIVHLKYPKPGRTNPSVSLWMTDLTNILRPKRLSHRHIKGFDSDHYLTAVSWIEDKVLATVWMRRSHNYSVVSICRESLDWTCEKNFENVIGENSSGWVELFDPPLITSDKKDYLIRLPLNDGKFGPFRQIAMISLTNRIQNFITDGQNDVTNILAYKSDTDTVFYEGTLESSHVQRHIFSISDIHSSTKNNPICLTCNQMERNCTFQRAIFSPKANYFILQCLGMGCPWTEIRAVDGNKILLKKNSDEVLENLLKYRAYPQLRTFQVPIGGFYANVRLILPPGLREYEEIKFPLVVEIGSEPGEQDVKNRFAVDWGSYLASSRDFIYAHIDVRGSRGSGDTLLHQTWHQIGIIDVEDYMKVVKYLKEELDYVDKMRIAVWGWAYGGFVAATSLALFDQKIFNCSLAVAPITNWLYSDSFTAERYFGIPWTEGSHLRYENADLIKKAKLFKDKRLFLLHGTADDEVHLQHTYNLMKALNRAGVFYRSQIYPDSNHNLEDVKLHLYRSLETYLDECFGLEEEQEEKLKDKNEKKKSK